MYMQVCDLWRHQLMPAAQSVWIQDLRLKIKIECGFIWLYILACWRWEGSDFHALTFTLSNPRILHWGEAKGET